MKVRATKLLYYGLRRRKPGEMFTISGPEEFSHDSMESLDPKAILPPRRSKKLKHLRERRPTGATALTAAQKAGAGEPVALSQLKPSGVTVPHGAEMAGTVQHAKPTGDAEVI